MARKTDLCRSAKGLFVRSLGWKAAPKGGYAQHKFYLGRDEAEARLASLRLEQLWQQITARWRRENDGLPPPDSSAVRVEQRSTGMGNGCVVVSSIGLGLLRTGDRPAWDETTLLIAEAVRLGEPVARLPLPGNLRDAGRTAAAHWLGRLQEDITVIKLELQDDAAQLAVEESFEEDGRRLIGLGRKLLQKRTGGETLHAALDAYRKMIEAKFAVDGRLTAWGTAQLRQVKFLRRHLANCALAELDGDRIDELVDVLRRRPPAKSGQRISASWAKNCLKQFRSFLRWLGKSQQFEWRRPADFEWSPVRIPVTAEEKSARLRSSQVETYASHELKTCWEYATPFQRLLLLLALNCGFGRAEVAALGVAEVHLRQPHPHQSFLGFETKLEDSWICRLRGKTDVYGEWKLWPITVTAIDWWLRQREAIDVAEGVTTLLLSRQGRRFDEPTKGNHTNFQIPNSWFSLSNRIRKDIPQFRRLSFNKLRKTAGNLVRAEAGGEIAGVFLAHGTPVKVDELLDVYTDRPFGKVHAAIDAVGERLSSLWTDVAEPFPEQRKLGGANISRAKIKRIETMREQGFRVERIAKEVGVSTGTVRRWSRR